MTIKLQGKEYVTHVELVEWATAAGLNSVSTEILHIDVEAKTVIIQATASGERGTFQGIGDAIPGNVGRAVSAHWIRMAETRAVNRALRLYTGRATTSIDELGDNPTPGPETDAPKHDAWWTKGGGKWACSQLSGAGLDYNSVAAWCESQKWGRPSGWSEQDVRKLVADLITPDSKARRELDAWVAVRAKGAA